MDEYESVSHTSGSANTTWCSFRKCRRKSLYVGWRKHLGEMFRHLQAEREPDRRWSSDERPCAYAALDTAAIRGVAGRGVY